VSVRFPAPVFALAILAPGLAIGSIHAATASASFGVSATVQASCLATVSAPATGAYAAATNAPSAVSVACSNSAPYSVSFDSGLVHDAAVALRPISGSGFALLGYAQGPNLRRTTNERQDLSTIAATGFGVGSVTELGFPRRLSAQCAASDAYIDTVIVVVTY
jgi:spore coat protein U-like protein